MPWRDPCTPYFEGRVVGNSPLGGCRGGTGKCKVRDGHPSGGRRAPCIPLSSYVICKDTIRIIGNQHSQGIRPLRICHRHGKML